MIEKNEAALAAAKAWLAEGDESPLAWGVGHNPTEAAAAERRRWVVGSIAHLGGPLARKAARAVGRAKARRYLMALNRHNSAIAQK
jgi:hypothetical protein